MARPSQQGLMFEYITLVEQDQRDDVLSAMVASGRSVATATRYEALMYQYWIDGDTVNGRPGWAYRAQCQQIIADDDDTVSYSVQPPQGSNFRAAFPDRESAFTYVNDIGQPDYAWIVFGQYEYEVWILDSTRDGGSAPSPGLGFPTAPAWGDAPDGYEP